MFRPILICPALSGERTKIQEVWFPGAHADVGGGYERATELPDISMKWMVDGLAGSFPLNAAAMAEFKGNPLGVSHWSIADSPANLGSSCEDRVRPAGAQLHPSVQTRRAQGEAPVNIRGVIEPRPYPLSCDDERAR